MRHAFVACVFVGCGSSSDQPPPTGPITATVTHYDVAFDLTTRKIDTTLTLNVTTAGDCITLPFRADALVADTAILNDAPAGGSLQQGKLTLCGDSVPVGAATAFVSATVPAKTQSPTQVGFSVTNNVDGNPVSYLVSWVGGCDQFTACDSTPSAFATYTFTITHDPALQVACPGTLSKPADNKTICDFRFAGGPTYSTFGFIAGTFTAVDKGSWAGVRTSVWDNTTGDTADAITQPYYDQAMTFLTNTFGPYPYGEELRIIAAPTYWAGFEHPGNIVLDERLISLRPNQSAYADPLAHTLVHELVHQWAGDQTTLADTYDFVWKEAMAEYITFLFEESVSPGTALTTARAWKLFGAGAAYHLVPTNQPKLIDYYGDVYGPGPLVLFRQLATQYSKEAVLAALQSVLGQERALSMTDLQTALSDAVGEDLTAYFDAWVYGEGAPEWPRVNALFARTGATTGELTITHTNPTSPTCVFHVGLGPNAAPGILTRVDLSAGASQIFTISNDLLGQPGYETPAVTVDPNAECMVLSANAVKPQRRNPWVLSDLLP